MECVASRRTCVCVCFFFFWRGGGGNTGNCVHCLSGCKIIYPIGEIGTFFLTMWGRFIGKNLGLL